MCFFEKNYCIKGTEVRKTRRVEKQYYQIGTFY